MSEYKDYMHVVKLGTNDAEGILDGNVWFQPKVDGTSASIDYDAATGVIHFHSRHRELSLENDNAGCMARLHDNPLLLEFFVKNPNLILRGEYLVRHTVKDYRDNAWNKLYIYDVEDKMTGRLLSYDDYFSLVEPLLESESIDVIPIIGIVKNPTEEDILHLLNQTTYLMKDGAGLGEGLVLKNYGWKNQYGRTVWAKVVRTEFKDRFHTVMGANSKENNPMEALAVEKYITSAFVEKEFAKLKLNLGGWESKYIPRLLSSVYHEFIDEHTWDILKDFKNPTIDFAQLQRRAYEQIKRCLTEVF
jgi:hypothetical protein